MPKERLDRAPNLQAILNVKANWEPNIDYAECHARGISVLSAAPAMAPAVAEFCVGQAIMLLRGLHKSDALFRTGTEAYGIGGNQMAKSLYGADIAMIGYGNLGRALAPLLRPFGVNLMVHDPWLSDGYLRTELGLGRCFAAHNRPHPWLAKTHDTIFDAVLFLSPHLELLPINLVDHQ